MKTATFALATALALVGAVHPSVAQPIDQSSANQPYGQDEYGHDMYRPMTGEPDQYGATSGAGDDSMDRSRVPDRNWREDQERNWGRGGDQSGRSRDQGAMMRRMWLQRQMMMGRSQSTEFHFMRGNERMDVKCPPQVNLRSCVNAASALLGEIATLRSSGDRGNTSGSGPGSMERGRTNGSGGVGGNSAPDATEQGRRNLPGTGSEDAPAMPRSPM